MYIYVISIHVGLLKYRLLYSGTNSETISDNAASFSKLNGFQLSDSDYYLETEDVSDEEGVLAELRNTPDYEELIWLKRIRREKEFEQAYNDMMLETGNVENENELIPHSFDHAQKLIEEREK